MIFSNDCWMKHYCKKYGSGNHECDNNQFCIKLFKIHRLYQESLLSDKQKDHIVLKVDADGSDRQAFSRLKEIESTIESWVQEGNNLYIYSATCGNGKTAWATRLLQRYIERIWTTSELTCRCLFINVPRFLLSLKDNISTKSDYVEHIKNNILTADVVVWDEVAIKSLTSFEHENLLNMINSRLDMNKSNIYTSNLSGSTLLECVGERLYSRVINCSECIEFVGKDKRGLSK